VAPEGSRPFEDRTRYDPSEVEPRVLGEWLESGTFHPEATGSPGGNFSIAIPPPNVTGELHMGHALNGTLQDVLARMRRMQERNTLWALGTDHAGIATQIVVERQLESEGLTREELGREAFERRVWEWREQYGSKIVEQYKRLGASCDYERERFTMDELYVRAVYKVFQALYDKGYIYRDNYMVNWDPGSRTAISDLEVEHRDVEDTLYHIDYPLESGEMVRSLTHKLVQLHSSRLFEARGGRLADPERIRIAERRGRERRRGQRADHREVGARVRARDLHHLGLDLALVVAAADGLLGRVELVVDQADGRGGRLVGDGGLGEDQKTGTSL